MDQRHVLFGPTKSFAQLVTQNILVKAVLVGTVGKISTLCPCTRSRIRSSALPTFKCLFTLFFAKAHSTFYLSGVVTCR